MHKPIIHLEKMRECHSNTRPTVGLRFLEDDCVAKQWFEVLNDSIESEVFVMYKSAK